MTNGESIYYITVSLFSYVVRQIYVTTFWQAINNILLVNIEVMEASNLIVTI